LFEKFQDEIGLDVPLLKCIGDEATASAAAEKGKCRLPGAEPLSVDTKKLVAEGESQIAQMLLFCDEPRSLGALHFPFAGIHVMPKTGRLVMAINRRRADKEMDGYVGEYHLCPNHHVYVHTFAEKVQE
jgi:hypothetical protein